MSAQRLFVLVLVLISGIGVNAMCWGAEETSRVSSLPVELQIPANCRCFVCGMHCDAPSPFRAQGLNNGVKVFFCDIGDMLYALGKHSSALHGFVQDMTNHQWIDAGQAWFVQSDGWQTPMGWGIAAFAARGEAERFGIPMNLEQAVIFVQ